MRDIESQMCPVVMAQDEVEHATPYPLNKASQSEFDAVLFDMDGTICNTEDLYHQAWAETFILFGYPPDALIVDSLRGLPASACLPALKRSYEGVFDCEKFLARKQDRYRELHRTNLALCPGVEAAVARLAANSVPMALVTSACRFEVEANASRFEELFALFTAIVSLDDVEAPKPAPDPYLLAARRLRLHPSNCLAVEDSITGVRSALAAGCEVALIGSAPVWGGGLPSRFIHVVPDASHLLPHMGLT